MADKWGHPFFYETAKDAGVSGSGSGFFWQQHNDIRDDSDNCMVRIGKELDDNDFKVISTTTGEWQFPYDSGADYYCLELGTGHHSGGESHGCEGCEYNVNVTINTTPPQFYFQKQMYHGGNKYEKGRMTHPKFTQKIVGNGWFGFCGVRYNVKDGVSSGKDSVKIEIWASPDGSKEKWVKVTTIEDKGKWGSGGDSCGGASDQILTWSGVQFRYKSGTPEWSVHPIIKECEEGDNIHCIDEEDMCFSASAKRGYCKDARIPRDVEQKILFKFDENDGIARLKNASLREIDAVSAGDDNPDQPGEGEQPGETQTIQGKFKLQWDLNSVRESECAGVGTGGSGGTSIFYEITVIDQGIALTDVGGDYEHRTRAAELCLNSSSPMNGKKIKQLDVPLKKTGSPAASPVIRAKIWNASNSVVYTSPTTIDPTGLTTDFNTISFDFSTNTHTLVTGDRVGIEYTGTGGDDHIAFAARGSNIIGNSQRSSYKIGTGEIDPEWYEYENEELCCTMWT